MGFPFKSVQKLQLVENEATRMRKEQTFTYYLEEPPPPLLPSPAQETAHTPLQDCIGAGMLVRFVVYIPLVSMELAPR